MRADVFGSNQRGIAERLGVAAAERSMPEQIVFGIDTLSSFKMAVLFGDRGLTIDVRRNNLPMDLF